MDREPRLRIMRVTEDADEDGVLRVPEPDYMDMDPGEAPEEIHEAAPRPGWICEHCGAPNDDWRDPCGMCGEPREDVEE